MVETTLYIAFVAGILSFLSPCVLPLIPAFLAYLAGTSPKTDTSNKFNKTVFINSIFFVLGFAVIFSILGVLLNSVLSNVSTEVRTWLGYIGGTIIILFGLYLLGLIKIAFLDREHKFKAKRFKSDYATSFVFGSAFAVGWTPCVGAILATILTLAVISPSMAFPLLLAYTLGLGIPFLIVGAFTSRAINWINKYQRFLKYFNIVVGILLIVLGIFVFTSQLSQISNFAILNRFLL